MFFNTRMQRFIFISLVDDYLLFQSSQFLKDCSRSTGCLTGFIYSKPMRENSDTSSIKKSHRALMSSFSVPVMSGYNVL